MEYTPAICRACLSSELSDSESGKGLSLFEKCDDFMISEKILSVTGVDITPGDGLPDRICCSCLIELETAYKFKLKCEKSQVILSSSVNLGSPRLELIVDIPIKEEFQYEYIEENNLSMSEQQREDKNNLDCDDNQPKIDKKKIEKKVQCDDCGRFYKNKLSLQAHRIKVHPSENLICPDCKQKFKTFKTLEAHLKFKSERCLVATHARIEGVGSSRIFYCKNCDYHTRFIQSMLLHSNKHTGEQPHSRDYSGKAFKHVSTRKTHKKDKRKAIFREGTCHHCGKHVIGRDKLVRHIRYHTNKSMPCKQCPKILSSKSALVDHMKRHSGVKSYSCEMCGYLFATSSNLCTHRQKVHFKNVKYGTYTSQQGKLKPNIVDTDATKAELNSTKIEDKMEESKYSRPSVIHHAKYTKAEANHVFTGC